MLGTPCISRTDGTILVGCFVFIGCSRSLVQGGGGCVTWQQQQQQQQGCATAVSLQQRKVWCWQLQSAEAHLCSVSLGIATAAMDALSLLSSLYIRTVVFLAGAAILC
jgi:hypothetical protein